MEPGCWVGRRGWGIGDNGWGMEADGVEPGDEFFGGKIGGKGIDLYLGAVIEWCYHKLYP